MQKVVVLGAAGQLGTDLGNELASMGADYLGLTHTEIEVCDKENTYTVLAKAQPDVVINTTAFHNLDACEDDPTMAFAVNSSAVWILSNVCNQIGARLINLSTDYVFDGTKNVPYGEDDPVHPLSAYGASKASGELILRTTCHKWMIIRTSGLYGVAGVSGKGGNFVETMLRLGHERGRVSVVTDQILSPTYTVDLAKTLIELVQSEAHGVFQVTNSGECSWFEFARAIFELSDQRVEVQPTTTAVFGSNVARPSYSVLSNQRLRELGIRQMRHWKDALMAYLEARHSKTSG